MRPIKFGDAEKQILRDKFEKFLLEMKPTSTGSVSFSDTACKIETNQRATIRFRPMAYIKMMNLINHCDGEVAWRYVTERVSDTEFFIKDVLLYPQYVSAAYVDTDEAEYGNWENSLPPEVYGSLFGQGHSHVNFAPNPSGTDDHDEEVVLNHLWANDYFVFMIWNKKGEWFARIFDMATNTCWEKADIDIVIGDGSEDSMDIVSEVKEKVRPINQMPGYKPAVTSVSSAIQSTGSKKKKKADSFDRFMQQEDDEDDAVSAYYKRYCGQYY